MMDDSIFDDPFGTQSITPPMSSMQTKGTAKLLVVIFIVDCSMTMKDDRIGAVNAALRELKYILKDIKEDNGLDMRVAIMSFTSSAKWVLGLTPVEELNLDDIQVRPGLTEYGAAFHELNKVLRKDQFMQHSGKIAPPAIMFLTDGEPTDDYQSDLNELLKNGWFVNASRSAVLLGDAIYNASAKEAVRQFVDDPETEIVAAEDSTVIMQKLKIATMHTVAGVPIIGDGTEGGNGSSDSASGKDDPFTGPDDPFGQAVPAGKDDPFAGDNDPFAQAAPAGGNDPFAQAAPAGGDDPFAQAAPAGDNDPFSQAAPGRDNDPFGQAASGGDNDPFGQAASAGANDPFAQAASGGDNDPFGQAASAGANDPFAQAAPGGDNDPFVQAAPAGGDDPFAQAAPAGDDDPFAGGDDDPFDLDSVFDTDDGDAPL